MSGSEADRPLVLSLSLARSWSHIPHTVSDAAVDHNVQKLVVHSQGLEALQKPRGEGEVQDLH